jgi:signal transduction histidine kinase/ActR/RegA family two-component response regulator
MLRAAALENVKATLAARQRAEQALELRTNELARSLALVRATLESSVSGILVTDHGTITDFNEKYLQMWPVPRAVVETFDHDRVLEFIAEQFADPRGFLDGVDEIYVTSPPESFDVLRLKDGRTFERFTKTQIVDGGEVGRVWSFRDITTHKRTEESLREETRILEVLNRTGASLASELDLQALLQTVTDAATQVTGAQFGAFFYNSTDEDGDAYMLFTLSGAPREAFQDFGHPRATPLFDPTFKGEAPIRLDDVLKDPRYGQMAPHLGIPSGHPPVRSYLAVPVISRSSEVIGGLLFGHAQPGQFTARHERLVVAIAAQGAIAIDNARLYESERSARSAAERMSDMKDRFLANLSHELRTPLNAVLGWAQILRRGVKDEVDLKNGLEAIERSARVQSQLIGDLLDTSRITSGKVRLDVQPLGPISFIDAAIETMRPAAEAKGIRLLSILDPVAGPVAGDPARLQQVMWNLLSNAIKFTPKDGRVQVMLERVNSHIEISVSDTGIGIKPEFVPHLFERFQQGDLSTTKAYGGLGLGLSIVKQLVELHGGTVRASSPGQDQGATFSIYLPITAVRQTSPAEERLHPEAPIPNMVPFEQVDLSGVKVLVVDDEQDARDLIKRLLSDCAADVLTAATAGEAMTLMELERPDILVSDIGMPDVDGYGLLKLVRAFEKDGTTKMPAVALTAFARSEDRIRALRAGFVAHVAKPIEPSELLATIAAFCCRNE